MECTMVTGYTNWQNVNINLVIYYLATMAMINVRHVTLLEAINPLKSKSFNP